jgi:hypothetical protein
MNRLSGDVDLFGVAGTHGDGIGALEITVHFIVAGQAIARPQRKDRK